MYTKSNHSQGFQILCGNRNVCVIYKEEDATSFIDILNKGVQHGIRNISQQDSMCKDSNNHDNQNSHIA